MLLHVINLQTKIQRVGNLYQNHIKLENEEPVCCQSLGTNSLTYVNHNFFFIKVMASAGRVITTRPIYMGNEIQIKGALSWKQCSCLF